MENFHWKGEDKSAKEMLNFWHKNYENIHQVTNTFARFHKHICNLWFYVTTVMEDSSFNKFSLYMYLRIKIYWLTSLLAISND